MSQVTSDAEGTPSRICCPCEGKNCSGEVICIETAATREVFARCAPLLDPLPDFGFDAQARRFYNCLPRLLEQAGGDVSHVTLERVFFSDFDRDMRAFHGIREEFYAQAGVSREQLPAMTYIEQPPCRAAQQLELQVQAVVPKSPGRVAIETFADEATDATGKILTIDGRRHLYIADIKGMETDSSDPGAFRQQADRMFANAARLLDQFGTRFTEVLRTWCYISDIDRNYDAFNLSRNAFFTEQGVTRLPASTGIEAGMWPAHAQCSMDLYALLDTDDCDIEVMHTPTLNEAAEYGSSFSRGMKIQLPEKTVLHISGTASVDEAGRTVHIGDVEKQIERMLLNVHELLKPHGARFEDLCQIATFLKYPEYLEPCQRLLGEQGIQRVPNTLVKAGVCRPDLLCEMEAVAILPR